MLKTQFMRKKILLKVFNSLRLLQHQYLTQAVWVGMLVLTMLLGISAKANNTAFNYLQQQDNTVSGTVTDAKGETLPGVSITVKGTAMATQSDVNGNYRITAAPNAVLVFSYLGFTKQEINVNNQSNINVTLAASAEALDEVVVIGYQTVRKQDLTGATGVINTRNTERVVTRSVPEALQGASAGVSVRNGGAPGQEAVVNIRGLGTFGNANPLYVIDGMFSDPNTTINPNDVESIQILKDASAAAIYGSRAGNGVIIITTKKGKIGEPKISVTSRYSISQIPKKYEMMDGAQYAATNKQAYVNVGLAPQLGVANYDGKTNTNWADEIIGTGAVQDYNATISGGSNTSKYLISAGYFKDEGTLLARNFDRTSLRINTETTKGRFKFGENMAISTSNNSSPFQGGFAEGNPWYDAFNSVPLIPVQNNALISNNNPGGWGYGGGNINTFSRNQVAIANITNTRSNFTKIFGNAFMDFKIADWLSYRLNAGVETSFDKSKSVRKEGSWYQGQSPELSRLSENRFQFLSYLFEHTLNFNKKFNKHSINGVVGYTEQTNRSENISGDGVRIANYGGTYFTSLSATSTNPGDRTSSGSSGQDLLNSYLGRLNYNYDDRYLATFTFRADKDSRFSPNFKTGFFPSGALAWRISKEDFFKINWISDLKVRGSYGVVGINTLRRYEYTPFLNQAPSYVFGVGQIVQSGVIQARIAPERLKWESKATTNLGLDASFLNSSLNLGIDIFRSVSKDVLVEVPVSQFLGNIGPPPVQNAASIQNQGIEVDLGYRPANQTGNFKWDVAANVSVIRNKILSFGNLGIDEATGRPRDYIQSGNTRSQVGRSIGEYYVIKTDGIFQNQAEIDAHQAQAAYAKPGDIRYVNAKNVGGNDEINDADRQFVGSPWPKFTTGFQFNSSFKNFTFNMQWYGAFGQTLYNDVIRDLDSYGNSNYRKDINPWTPTNTNTKFPRLGYQFSPDRGMESNARVNTDRWLENGSFLRLRNLELGYNIPAKIFGKAKISNARIYVSGQNLITITKYRGLDPDVVGANINLEPGVDNGNYPSSRIISFGLGFGF